MALQGYTIEGGRTSTKTQPKKTTTSYTKPRTSGFDFDEQTQAALISNPPSTMTYTPAPTSSGTPTLTPKAGVSTPTYAPPQTTTVPPPTSVAPPTVQPPQVNPQPETQQPQQPSGGGGRIADATAFDSGTLTQILAALEAKYGLSREQLLAESGEVGRLYRFINANLGRMEQDASRGNVESSLGRGILRSGIHLENQANIERDFGERRAQAEGEKATKLAYIQNQLATLQSELEQDRMVEAQRFGQRGMDFARQYASTF